MTELESQVRDVLSRLLPEVPATDRAPLVDAYIARRARAEQDRMERLWARLRPPSNEVPGLLALSTVLGRNDSIAVVLTRIDVFSSGLRLHVSTWGRPGQHAPLLPTQPELAERMGTSLASRPQISLTWNGAPTSPPPTCSPLTAVTDSCRSAAARHFRRPRVRRPAARRTVADSSPAPDFARRDLQLARAEPVRDNNRSTRGGARGGGPDHTNAVAWHLGCRRADGPSRSVYRTPRQPNSQPCR